LHNARCHDRLDRDDPCDAGVSGDRHRCASPRPFDLGRDAQGRGIPLVDVGVDAVLDPEGTAVEGSGRAPRIRAGRRPWGELSRHAHLTMSKRIARQLVRLYPSAWRARYEDEFVALLESRDLGWRDVLDVSRGATREWLRSTWFGRGVLIGLETWMTAAIFSL